MHTTERIDRLHLLHTWLYLLQYHPTVNKKWTRILLWRLLIKVCGFFFIFLFFMITLTLKKTWMAISIHHSHERSHHISPEFSVGYCKIPSYSKKRKLKPRSQNKGSQDSVLQRKHHCQTWIDFHSSVMVLFLYYG